MGAWVGWFLDKLIGYLCSFDIHDLAIQPLNVVFFTYDFYSNNKEGLYV